MEGSKAVVGLDFKEGIGRYSGLVDMFVKAGVFKKAGSWFSYGEERIGQGEKQVYDNLPSILTETMIDDLQTYVTDTFCYGAYSDPDGTYSNAIIAEEVENE